MSVLEQIEQLLPQLSQAEKNNLTQWLLRNLSNGPTGIEAKPRVCGGEPCLVGTRIPVWLVEQARRLGKTEAQILEAFPTLRAEDLANAWAFVRFHREEIDQQIRDNEEA